MLTYINYVCFNVMKNISKNKIKQIKMISFYVICSIILFILLGNEVTRYFTPLSFVIILTTILFTCIAFYFVKRRNKDKVFYKDIFDFRSFNYTFLRIKIFDVLAQQLLVILLVYIGRTYGGNYYFLLSALLFILLHLLLLFFNSFKVSMFFIILSLPASIIFVYIYSNLGLVSFGIGYFIHLSFYLVLGILDLNGRKTKIIGE